MPFELSARFMGEQEEAINALDRKNSENFKFADPKSIGLDKESVSKSKGVLNSSITSNRNNLKIKCHATDKNGIEYDVQLGP